MRINIVAEKLISDLPAQHKEGMLLIWNNEIPPQPRLIKLVEFIKNILKDERYYLYLAR